MDAASSPGRDRADRDQGQADRDQDRVDRTGAGPGPGPGPGPGGPQNCGPGQERFQGQCVQECRDGQVHRPPNGQCVMPEQQRPGPSGPGQAVTAELRPGSGTVPGPVRAGVSRRTGAWTSERSVRRARAATARTRGPGPGPGGPGPGPGELDQAKWFGPAPSEPGPATGGPQNCGPGQERFQGQCVQECRDGQVHRPPNGQCVMPERQRPGPSGPGPRTRWTGTRTRVDVNHWPGSGTVPGPGPGGPGGPGGRTEWSGHDQGEPGPGGPNQDRVVRDQHRVNRGQAAGGPQNCGPGQERFQGQCVQECSDGQAASTSERSVRHARAATARTEWTGARARTGGPSPRRTGAGTGRSGSIPN